MAILKNEFITFYNDEVKYYGNGEIREKKKNLKNDFEKNFPENFKNKYSESIKLSEIRFIDQGSYSIGTTIKHGNTAFDIDVATIIDLDINKYDNVLEVKEIVKNSLKNINRNPVIKEPCVTVKYTKSGEEKYHLDFPIYANYRGNLYLARGKDEKNMEWQVSDPEGLNEYFTKENLQIDGLNLTDEEKEKRKQKKRLIRYIKWWKAEKYGTSTKDHEVPPSIALTILICEKFRMGKFDNEYNDLKSLYETVKEITKEIFVKYSINGEEFITLKTCNLPTKPWSDCFFKIRKSNSYIKTFYVRWTNLEKNLKDALEQKDERIAGEILVKVFGDKFPLPEYDEVNSEDSFAR